MSEQSARGQFGIGEVLAQLQPEFPDISTSKIRFLEAEGLIEPERTPSGYRKFYVDDVERLKSILRMQRDEYLPLKVIKERLLQGTDGELFDEDGVAIESDGGAGAPISASEELAEAPTGLQMSLEEMSAATGVERDRIKELESFGIVCSHGPDGARYYDGDDYIVLSIVKDFFRFGVEPRHLTMYKHFEEREADFFETIVAPTLRQKNPDARRAASQALADLAVTSRKFKQALLRSNLRDNLKSA
jgi:DNA-binding transcriptional MerR regulator